MEIGLMQCKGIIITNQDRGQTISVWCPVEQISVLITKMWYPVYVDKITGKTTNASRVRSKLLSHTFENCLQLLLWTLPNSALSLPLRNSTFLVQEPCALWLASTLNFFLPLLNSMILIPPFFLIPYFCPSQTSLPLFLYAHRCL